MNRQTALNLLRVAGYHSDRKTFVRVYVENRVSLQATNQAYDTGANQKKAGMPCGCIDCKREKEAAHANE